MGSVAQKTQSPPSVEIDGVLYRICGEGRKRRATGSIDCGDLLPLTAEYWPRNDSYTDGYGIACLKCTNAQQERYTARLSTALVPAKVDVNVPIGSGAHCRAAWLEEDGKPVPYLVVSEICHHWGLDVQGQTQRIQEDPTLLAGLMVCKLHTIQGVRPVNVLRYNLVPQWLMGIETAKMRNKERARDLAAFQKVGGQALADYFFGTKTAPPPPAQRTPTDGTISHDDGPVLRYLDTAMSRTEVVVRNTIEQTADELFERRIKPYLDTILMVETKIEVPAEPRVERGEMYFGTLNPRLVLAALEEGEADDWAGVSNLADLLKHGYECLIIGMTVRGEKKRTKEHSGKNRIGKTHPVRSAITTDDPRRLNDRFAQSKHGMAIAVPGTIDLFVVHPSVIKCICALPSHITIEDAKWHLSGWVWGK
jgi:hypothetical protein